MRKVIPIALMLMALAACRGERIGERIDEKPAAAAPAAAPSSSFASKIQRADGSELASISESAGIVEIKFANRTFRGETRDSGKRKYESEGRVLYEVKPGDEGFKLRRNDGKLHWKVKIKDAKVKISDNEENNNPFELKSREGDRIKVVGPGDREIGNVRGKNVEDASGKRLYVVDGPNAAYGVLLLDSIPEAERYILVAELLARGR